MRYDPKQALKVEPSARGTRGIIEQPQTQPAKCQAQRKVTGSIGEPSTPPNSHQYRKNLTKSISMP